MLAFSRFGNDINDIKVAKVHLPLATISIINSIYECYNSNVFMYSTASEQHLKLYLLRSRFPFVDYTVSKIPLRFPNVNNVYECYNPNVFMHSTASQQQ